MLFRQCNEKCYDALCNGYYCLICHRCTRRRSRASGGPRCCRRPARPPTTKTLCDARLLLRPPSWAMPKRAAPGARPRPSPRDIGSGFRQMPPTAPRNNTFQKRSESPPSSFGNGPTGREEEVVVGDGGDDLGGEMMNVDRLSVGAIVYRHVIVSAVVETLLFC